jgi:phosphoglycolate phosphatase
MAIKAAVFDLDGTLLDTLADLAKAGNQVLQRAGLPIHPVEAYRYFVGDGIDVLTRRILPEELRHDDTVSQFTSRMRKAYSEIWADETKPYEGIPEMLGGLAQKGLDLAILSNKPHDMTLLTVRHFFDAKEFVSILGAREGVPKKPDPAGALETARILGHDPAELLYVGDTATDMLTANAAGMYAVGVTWGFRTAKELQESGAKLIIDHPLELLKKAPLD